MRILHTADWHLGRTLHGEDLLPHQAAYLDHLVELAAEERVDAVLVAGDVYDRAIPPVDAVHLLSETLRRLAEHTRVVVVSGNHDSAVRLGFGAGLLRPGVHVRTSVQDVGRPVVLPDRSGRDGALVYPLPYLDPDAARAELGGDLPRSHRGVLGEAMRRVRGDIASRLGSRTGQDRPSVVVMAHAFVVGGAASDSERDIRVGGVDSVPAAVLAGDDGAPVDYVALGHLHGPQAVSGPSLTRYAGSPLAYSFSERSHAKSTALIELRPGVFREGPDALAPEAGSPTARLVPAPVPRRLADLTGDLETLLGAAGEAHVDDWVRVTVTDAVRPPELYPRVRARFPHALVVQHAPPAPAAGDGGVRAVHAASDPLAVAEDFVRFAAGRPPSVSESAVLRRAWEDVLAGERSA